jgi:hypothetical protein
MPGQIYGVKSMYATHRLFEMSKLKKLTMHKFNIALVVLFAALTLTNCCKVYCPRELMSMRLIGFDPEDLDTIIIRKYEPSNFSNPIDSLLSRWSVSPLDTLYFDYFDSQGFEFSKNYEISFPGISKIYRSPI